jgi:hypothetical protein
MTARAIDLRLIVFVDLGEFGVDDILAAGVAAVAGRRLGAG